MNYDMQPIVNVMDNAITKLNKMKAKTQKEQIRFYLESGGKLTPMAALNFWGCFRLSARISNIKDDYLFEYYEQKPSNRKPIKHIHTEIVKTASGKRIAEYSLKNLA